MADYLSYVRVATNIGSAMAKMSSVAWQSEWGWWMFGPRTLGELSEGEGQTGVLPSRSPEPVGPSRPSSAVSKPSKWKTVPPRQGRFFEPQFPRSYRALCLDEVPPSGGAIEVCGCFARGVVRGDLKRPTRGSPESEVYSGEEQNDTEDWPGREGTRGQLSSWWLR